MNTYVKITGHKNWFREILPDDPKDIEFNWNMQERILKATAREYFYPKTDNTLLRQQAIARVNVVRNNFCDYFEVARKYNCPVYVRENGSYITVAPSIGQKVEKRILAHGFPVKPAEIVICENDEFPEPFWLAYLIRRFPGKTIETINYFNQRSIDEVKDAFASADYITFSTTFSSYNWYEKAVSVATANQKVIGYAYSESSWKQALKIATSKGIEVEVVLNKDIT